MAKGKGFGVWIQWGAYTKLPGDFEAALETGRKMAKQDRRQASNVLWELPSFLNEWCNSPCFTMQNTRPHASK